MKDLVLFLSQILLGWLFVQITIISKFLYSLGSGQSISDEELPKAAIILSLRGADPFLSHTLRSLLQQNYPIYNLKIVVDSLQDPAWDVATSIINEYNAQNVQISPLRNPLSTCSLKCSSIVQAVSELDSSYQVVALVDADAVVHPNWLRDLVSPLSNPKIGATTGNRWYLPTGDYWGSMVRYLWNVSAVIQMVMYQIAWGGSLAIKTEAIRKTGLIDVWKHSYTDDTILRSLFQKHGLRVQFVPSIIILNREECKLFNLLPWLRRQLLTSRLYHPCWILVVADSVFTILLPTTILALSLILFLIGEQQTAGFTFAVFFSYTVVLVIFTLIIDSCIRRIIRDRNEIIPSLSLATVAKIFIATPFTQWTSGLVMLSSLWVKSIEWRGVRYRIKSPWNIELVEYIPYRFVNKSNQNKISL
ncbi:glycosyltransferase family 2 protein [Calothrix sp. UHCC 0171]|uniref:glycosyltransferase n=1 Tax=Calothrix sp. UHCC 0171 TaxID=3110245 RepID=UPI002B2121E1|nr:glycosyltransferase family 2 protein [Calothrix sp. UHCC 0171]MEA5572922.1 glycosyltransferase family 2 protein [Calothrix sp. UHCC 0171]